MHSAGPETARPGCGGPTEKIKIHPILSNECEHSVALRQESFDTVTLFDEKGEKCAEK